MRVNKFNTGRGCIIFGLLVFAACLTAFAQERRAIKLPGSEGLPFSDGVIAGDTLYVAGQEGTDEKGKLAAGGTTPLLDALYVALKQFGNPRSQPELRRRALVLLSDGEDTASRQL